jgi:hypothetical protein
VKANDTGSSEVSLWQLTKHNEPTSQRWVIELMQNTRVHYTLSGFKRLAWMGPFSVCNRCPQAAVRRLCNQTDSFPPLQSRWRTPRDPWFHHSAAHPTSTTDNCPPCPPLVSFQVTWREDLQRANSSPTRSPQPICSAEALTRATDSILHGDSKGVRFVDGQVSAAERYSIS